MDVKRAELAHIQLIILKTKTNFSKYLESKFINNKLGLKQHLA